MRRHILALIFVAAPLAVALLAAHEADARSSSRWRDSGRASAASVQVPPRAPRGVDLDALDRKSDPCVDFYQYACGGWIAKNPLPSDRRSYGRFTEVQERNFTILRRILETTTEGDADRRKASDYYAACMDESTIEAAGLAPLRSDLATIDELLNPDDLPVLLAHLHAIGVRALFRFSSDTDVVDDPTQQIADLDQSGLSLPDRDYYLKTDARSIELRDKFASTVQTMLTGR